MMLQGLIFDVDGTLADTETAHLAAFNRAFDEEGLGWHWESAQYLQLLEISGGKERILHFWRQVQPDLRDLDGNSLHEVIARIHALKTAFYEQAVTDGGVHLREGVLPLIELAHAGGLRLAIATTTSPVNITALLRKAIGLHWRDYFLVIEDASTAPNKKPHPQVYLNTLQRLGLAARQCLAVEDSANGLRAASAAGLATLITPNAYTQHQDFSGACQVLADLRQVTLAQLDAWLAQHHGKANNRIKKKEKHT